MEFRVSAQAGLMNHLELPTYISYRSSSKCKVYSKSTYLLTYFKLLHFHVTI